MTEEVKPGYKRTEIGVIPEDWNHSILSEVCVTSSGTTPARSQFDRYFRNGQINWVKTLDLNNKKILRTDEQVTPDALAETSLREYPAKTVLIAMYGGFNQIGRTGILGIPACVNQAITAIQCGTQLIPEYLLATLNFRVEHWKAVASSSRKDPNITSQDVRDFRIAYPTIKEQEKISEALSCIDALISSLDQLIAKKSDILQAAMQQLLTGQRRLPGFSGEWEVERLGDIADIDPESLPGNTPSNFEFRYISLEDVDTGSLTSYSEVTFGDAPSRARRRIRKNDILVSTVRPNLMSHLLFKGQESNWVCSTGFSVVRCKPLTTNTGFIFFHLFARNVNKQIDTLITGSNYPAINSGDVRNLSIPIPSTEEQAAIATILSDMDSELSALEARREKARQLKQGMMQELLTGRIRLA